MAFGKNSNDAAAMRERALQSKQLVRTWDRQHRELKRKARYDAREAEKKARQLEQLRKELKEFTDDVESGDAAGKEAKAVKRAVKELVESCHTWIEKHDPVAGTEAVTLALAVVGVQLLKMSRALFRAAGDLADEPEPENE